MKHITLNICFMKHKIEDVKKKKKKRLKMSQITQHEANINQNHDEKSPHSCENADDLNPNEY